MKGGTFRGFVAAMALAISRVNPWRTKTKHYPDPSRGDPYANRADLGGHPRGRSRQGKPRLGRPPLKLGTITYHDGLVRRYGRPAADHIQFLRRDEVFSMNSESGIGMPRCGWPTDISADEFIQQYAKVL